MTKKEQKKRKEAIKRSNRAIDKLNKPRRNRVLKEKVYTDLDCLRSYLDGMEMVYEEGINDSVRRYIFVNFDEDGDVIEPQ